MSTRSLASPKVEVKINAIVTNLLDDGSSATAAINVLLSETLTSGVSAGQANRGWQWKSRTLLAAATLVIDVFDFVGFDSGSGDGNDPVGQLMSPIEEIVTFYVKNESAVGATGILEIEPDGTDGWTPIGIHTAATEGGLRSGGVLLKHQPAEAGFDVTDASSHRVKLTANGADIIFSVLILGRHDDDESSSSSSSSSSGSSSSSSSSSSSQSSSSSSSQSSSSTSSSVSSDSSNSSSSSSSSP